MTHTPVDEAVTVVDVAGRHCETWPIRHRGVAHVDPRRRNQQCKHTAYCAAARCVLLKAKAVNFCHDHSSTDHLRTESKVGEEAR